MRLVLYLTFVVCVIPKGDSGRLGSSYLAPGENSPPMEIDMRPPIPNVLTATYGLCNNVKGSDACDTTGKSM